MNETKIESWKPIKRIKEDQVDFSSYSVSNLGSISKKGVIIKPYPKHGYMYVHLFSKSNNKWYCRRVHRFVAITWLTPPPNYKYEVNHIDGNRSNNIVSNLEWVTKQQNIEHRVKLHKRKMNSLNAGLHYGYLFEF